MASFGDHPQHRQVLPQLQHAAAEAGLELKKYEKKVNALLALLTQGESVLALSAGLREGDIRSRLLVVTDTRLLLLKNDPWDAVSIDLARITEIKSRRGFSLGRIDIRMYDGKVRIDNVHQQSVGIFAIRAEEARRQRHRADIASAVDPQFQRETHGFDPIAPELPPAPPPQPLIAPEPPQPSLPPPESRASQSRQLPGIVREGEQVQFFTTGNDHESSLSLAITDQRILALLQNSRGHSETVSINLDEITEVSGTEGPSTGFVSIRYDQGERMLGPVLNGMIDPFVSQVRSIVASRRPPTPPPPVRSLPSRTATLSPVEVAEKLEALASLLDRGLLTPAEFAEQKARLLNG